MAVVGMDVVVALVMRWAPIIAAAALLAPSLAAIALAQSRQVCGERAGVIAGLGAQYGERVAAQGVTAGGLLLELLVAPPLKPGDPRPPGYSEGSWTIIVTRPDRMSCIGASGEGWAPADTGGRG